MNKKKVIFITIFSILILLSAFVLGSVYLQGVIFYKGTDPNFFDKFNSMAVTFYTIVFLPILVLSVIGLVKALK